jgi:uncharacterized protein (TIGR03437 family)
MSLLPADSSAFRSFRIVSLIVFSSLCLYSLPMLRVVQAQSLKPFVTVSAASYVQVVTPDSIVAGFGPGLTATTATATTVPLPTTLGGVRVLVRDSTGTERPAGLFFVSPNQINYHIPPDTATGTATVTVEVNSANVAQGTVQVSAAAPAIFTANASGSGAPAGFVFRLKPDNSFIFENLFELRNGQMLPRPVDFTPNGDRLFLVLYLSGLRRANRDDVQVILGGNTLAPDAIAAHPNFVGLDQLNVELPAGTTGQLSLGITVNGFTAFNLTEIELFSTQQGGAQQISGLSSSLVTAGDQLTINGSGFSTTPEANEVFVLDSDQQALPAQVISSTASQIVARVPFGAGSGQVRIGKVSAAGTTANLSLRTSISGFVETTDRQPLGNVKVRVVGTTKEATTTNTGSFVIPDVAQGAALVEVDGSIVATPPYPKVTLKQNVRNARDNQMLPVRIAQSDGASIPVGSGGSIAEGEYAAPKTESDEAVNAVDLALDVPLGAKATFPDGSTFGVLTLTKVDGSRTPVDLPVGHFSSTIAQITPAGVTLTPGAKLTFPNNDNLPASSQATLFKLDLNPNSATVGTFIAVGAATVSADGQSVVTATNAITETGYYFVSITRQLAALYGHVVEAGGRPVRRAIVQTRGQSTFTDSNGGFVLRNVPALKANDQVTLDVSFMRPDSRVDRTERRGVLINANALTLVEPDITLAAKTGNRSPVLFAPPKLSLRAGESRDFDFVAADPDSGQTVQLSMTGNASSFAAISALGNDAWRLRLSPSAAGSYSLTLTATDNNGAKISQPIGITVNQTSNAPVANTQSVTTPEDTAKAITLTGSSAGGGALTYTIVSAPGRGSLSGAAPNLVYTPAKDFNGVDSFTFRVNSGATSSAVAVVYIAVSPVNDAPVLTVPGTQMINAGQPLSFTVSAFDPDNGQTLSITATGVPGGAALADISGTSKQFNWTTTFVQSGSYTITFKVTDNGNPSMMDQKTVTIISLAKFAKTSGPEGGEINCLLETVQTTSKNVSVVTLFAGTQGGGIYRSNDSGKTWTAINNGLDENGLRVNALVFANSTLYAGTNSGVWRSTDNGQNWTAFNANTTPDNPNFIWPVRALIYDGATLIAGTTRGVYRFNNSLQKFETINNGLVDSGTGLPRPIYSLAVHNNTLFAGGYSAVYRFTSATSTWAATAVGPNGDSLLGISLLSDGATLYAGGGNGVYRTATNGSAWTASNTGLPPGTGVFALTKTTNPTVLYVGLNGSGVYRSTDGGLNWSAVNTGLTSAGLIVQSLLNYGIYSVKLVNGQFVYTRTDALLAGTNDSVFRATSLSSINWQRVTTGITSTRIERMIAVGNDVYAGTFGSGVFRSSDNGQSWISVNNGALQSQLFIGAMTSVGNTVWAGAFGAFFSNDKGANWTALNNGFPGGAASVTSFGVVGTTLYAGTAAQGLYRLSGSQWVELTTFPDKNKIIYAVAGFLTRTGTTLFVGTEGGGVYRSTDSGQTWTAVNNGLTGSALIIYSLTIKGSVIIAGTRGSTYRSVDNGQSWQQVSGVPFAPSLVESLTVYGNSLFAASAGGVYRSNDDGVNWMRADDGLLNQYTTAVAATTRSLFVGTVGNGISVVTDSPQSWIEANGGLTNKSVNAIVANGFNFFAGTLGSGAFRTSSQGQSWTAASNGLPVGANVQAVMIHPANSSVYAATFGDGVFRSTTQAQGWTDASGNLPNKYITALENNGSTIFAAAVSDPRTGTSGGVFRSTNQGQTWTAVNTGLGNLNVEALIVINGVLFAGTDGGGVFRSANNGDSWTSSNSGLTSLDITSLARIGTKVFAGTASGGVFRSDLATPGWTAVNSGLPDNLPVFALAGAGPRIYAGSVYGVFLSTDQGATWQQVNAGLTDIYVTTLAVSGNFVVAGTRAGGVCVSQIR